MMQCVLTPYEVWDRAQRGPKIDSKQYDFKILPELTARLVREHEIKIKRDVIVPEDSSLADAIYRAAYELLIENGVYCLDTRRMIKLTEEELRESLRKAHSEVVLGQAKDGVRVVQRKVGESKMPVISAGPGAGPVSQEIFVQAHQSFAKETSVDVLVNGCLNEVDGHEVTPRSPYEIKAAKLEQEMAREACELAGRPGMALNGPFTPITPEGRLAADMRLRQSDMHEVSQLCELKIDSDSLMMIAHHIDSSNVMDVEYLPIMGGLLGTVEQTVISDVAGHLATLALYSGSLHLDGCVHVRWGVTSTRETLQVMAHTGVAVDRNTRILDGSIVYAMAGPCTKMSFIETAAQGLAYTASGQELIGGIGLCKGVLRDYVSGISARALGGICTAATKLNLKQTNEIINILLDKYDKKEYYKAAPKGKAFQECYDVKTVTPTDDHIEVYGDAIDELEEIGLPIRM